METVNGWCLLFHLIVLLGTVHRGLGNEDNIRIRHKTKADHIALQKAAQRLLGLGDIPTENDRPSGKFDVKMAPKYMLDLYEKYKDGRIHSGKQVANTVRSIQAQVGVISTQSMFVFNLSSIQMTEKILKAEVHLYKRRIKKSKEADIYMEMHELGPAFLRRLDHRRIPEVAQGWQAADVTTAVEACLHYDDGPPRMMALGFLTQKNEDEIMDRMTTRNLIRRISRPYLIVYSNDTQNTSISVDHIQPHIHSADLTATYVDPITGLQQKFSKYSLEKEGEEEVEEEEQHSSAEELPGDKIEEHTEDKTIYDTIKSDNRQWFGDKRFFDYFTKSSSGTPKAAFELTAKLNKKHRHYKDKHHNEVDVPRRHRRSVLDNEIPEDPTDSIIPQSGYTFPKTHPDILKGRTHSRHKLLPKRYGQLIPYPEDYKRQRRKQKRKK